MVQEVKTSRDDHKQLFFINWPRWSKGPKTTPASLSSPRPSDQERSANQRAAAATIALPWVWALGDGAGRLISPPRGATIILTLWCVRAGVRWANTPDASSRVELTPNKKHTHENTTRHIRVATPAQHLVGEPKVTPRRFFLLASRNIYTLPEPQPMADQAVRYRPFATVGRTRIAPPGARYSSYPLYL